MTSTIPQINAETLHRRIKYRLANYKKQMDDATKGLPSTIDWSAYGRAEAAAQQLSLLLHEIENGEFTE